MKIFNDGFNITGETDLISRIRQLESQVNTLQTLLASGTFLKGTLRTDRPAPTSSNDVLPPDRLYDVVRDDSYQYTLINLSGSVQWVRSGYNTF